MRFKDVIRSLVGKNKGPSAVRIVVVNKCYKRQKCVICWFPHLGFSFLGSTWSELTRSLKMSQEQTEDKNNVDIKRDDQPAETMDLGIVTLRLRGSGLVLESLLPDTMMDLGNMGADASTPVLAQNHHFGPRSVIKPRLRIGLGAD